MTTTGTAAYAELDGLPPLVERAVEAARASGFAHSCLPEHGELLRLLARGVRAGGVIGETGTGSGVGLAWLASGARSGTRLISVELEPGRASEAAEVFRELPEVTVLTGDWKLLHAHGPFDLLVLDGGGQGKGGEPPLEPAQWLRPGGLIVLDDFTPLRSWPPKFQGAVDAARLYWLEHPRLRATQVNVAPESSAVLATYVG